MANKKGKEVDTTFLSLDDASRKTFIHRDYIAHVFRWAHVVKHLQKVRGESTILDVGCGRELPLAKCVHSSRCAPIKYVGVDYGGIKPTAYQYFSKVVFPLFLSPDTDFLEWDGSYTDVAQDKIVRPREAERFTHITCFEVLEHVEPLHCINMIRKMAALLEPGGDVFISTPNWDMINCSDNHVNEIKHKVLGRVLQESFDVMAVYGTFISQRDVKEQLDDSTLLLYNVFKEYFHSDVLSNMWAAPFPERSRNALWHCTSKGWAQQPMKYPQLKEIPGPWSSSEKWEDFNQL